MRDVSLEVGTATVDPGCVRFIYRKTPTAASRPYAMRIVKHRIDAEMLAYSKLCPAEHPTEKQSRNWVFWLGHILSRFCEPKDCGNDCWVVNDIQSVAESESTWEVRGSCSPWLSRANDSAWL